MSSSYSINDDELGSDQSPHDHLGFYLGIYGGLAGANTVSNLDMIYLNTGIGLNSFLLKLHVHFIFDTIFTLFTAKLE